MKSMILDQQCLKRRRHWVNELKKISGDFGQDAARVDREIKREIAGEGLKPILDHLRLCGSIPERYGHDSSEEKLYSKYTDVVIAETFAFCGLNSIVLTERADAADVEVAAAEYSFVADGKAFRLSRTAKNQKDFKVQAMQGWRRGKPHAMVVCPLYQLPSRTSQIYQQAIATGVTIISYSHLAVIAGYAAVRTKRHAEELLLKVFRLTEGLNPDKGAVAYWQALNRSVLDEHGTIGELWAKEKAAMLESIAASKEEALVFLAEERARIMKLSRSEAIEALIGARKLTEKEAVIGSISDNGLFAIS